MVNDIGKILDLFSIETPWKELLYGDGRSDPFKLLNVALSPYMGALRECVKERYVDFPKGNRTAIVEGPEGLGKVVLPFTVAVLTQEELAKTKRLEALYLPLQRADLVEVYINKRGEIEAVTPTEQGKTLIERLEDKGYFGK